MAKFFALILAIGVLYKVDAIFQLELIVQTASDSGAASKDTVNMWVRGNNQCYTLSKSVWLSETEYAFGYGTTIPGQQQPISTCLSVGLVQEGEIRMLKSGSDGVGISGISLSYVDEPGGQTVWNSYAATTFPNKDNGQLVGYGSCDSNSNCDSFFLDNDRSHYYVNDVKIQMVAYPQASGVYLAIWITPLLVLLEPSPTEKFQETTTKMITSSSVLVSCDMITCPNGLLKNNLKNNNCNGNSCTVADCCSNIGGAMLIQLSKNRRHHWKRASMGTEMKSKNKS